MTFAGQSTTLSLNGADVVKNAALDSGTLSLTTANIGALRRTSVVTPFASNIAELLVYSRAVSQSERRRLEVYLAARWGITLAPTVSNADAQDWINRVYANGGTVSASTAAAVNTLCDSLDAASLRDRFYRLNLFCGSNLNAALVPLYLTPDKTVTNLFQFGTDPTNAAWLPGGNGLITRTATTEVGPLGYGYATKLTTPSAPFDVRQMHQQMPLDGRQVTVSAWMKTNSGTRQIQWLAGNVYSDTVTVTTTWQRFTKTFTLPTSTDARTGFSTVSELSDAAGFIYVWGMQCEYGATATSYNQPRYGNATDTNTGPFVSGDYAETGASGGLTGNGTTKTLRHGVSWNLLPDINSVHLSAYAFNAANDGSLLGAYWFHSTTAGERTSWELFPNGGTLGNTAGGAPPAGVLPALLTASRVGANSSFYYRNDSASAESTVSTSVARAIESTVFGRNLVVGSPPANNSYAETLRYSGRLGGYSLGSGMTGTQVAAYNAAMQAFQAALTRTA
jgi:hypothetical protein